ncbi:hypothetical protein FSB08_11465 [Paraburkholderia sp. JPY432]|uniref:hypothetical protein n=1 Tax=Paraburkholderia youngii TaxID=2782701 RepID=UPI00159619A1|nr:hypothetical protein [Paraburkholderia youngii]NVH73180.1 hypothetical protein [Paraburkholderia youngii]
MRASISGGQLRGAEGTGIGGLPPPVTRAGEEADADQSAEGVTIVRSSSAAAGETANDLKLASHSAAEPKRSSGRLASALASIASIARGSAETISDGQFAAHGVQRDGSFEVRIEREIDDRCGLSGQRSGAVRGRCAVEVWRNASDASCGGMNFAESA